ncbi:SAMC2, partial [Symbiodinium natans]
HCALALLALAGLLGLLPDRSFVRPSWEARPADPVSETHRAEGRRSLAAALLLAPLAAQAKPGVPTPVEVAPPLSAAWSGALQGIAQNIAKQVVLHPFDTVKTRLQAQAGRPEASRAELFRDVYRGLLPTLVSGTPGSAAFFAAKEAASAQLRQQAAPDPLPTLGGVVLGVLSAKAVKTPFDVAETKAMATVATEGEALAWDGSWGKLREAYDKEGFPGLYRGYGANVLYKLPADLAKFLAYEGLRGSGAAGSMPPGVAGAIATLASNAVTTPLDVVRTQVMVEGGGKKSSPNALEKLQELLQSGDSEQIWSGFGWRLARGVVAGAIQFTVLEGTKDAVEGRTKVWPGCADDFLALQRSSTALRRASSAFARFSALAVVVEPGAVVCLLAGASKMRPATFTALNIGGTIARLLALRLLASSLPGPLEVQCAVLREGQSSGWEKEEPICCSLAPESSTNIPPEVSRSISFGIPPEKWRETISLRQDGKKTMMFSRVIPGDARTYIYDTEDAYYAQYSKALFGITTKNMG